MSNWLGTGGDSFNPELFPAGTLNARQLRLLFEMNDRKFGRVTGVYVGQAISQITDEITEVHLYISKSQNISDQHGCVLWLDTRGEQVASAVEETNGARSFWVMPKDVGRFGRKPEEHTYRGLWTLGNHGAIPSTREFIKQHYTRQEVTS